MLRQSEAAIEEMYTFKESEINDFSEASQNKCVICFCCIGFICLPIYVDLIYAVLTELHPKLMSVNII